MAKLTHDAKVFAVTSLACWDTPTSVMKKLKEDFDIDITVQGVSAYNPTLVQAKHLSENLVKLFWDTRKAFLDDVKSVGISHRVTRIRRLHRMADRAEESGNMVLAASLLEQAAKEMGNSYTNRRELTGADGKPIETAAKIDVTKLSDEALKEILAATEEDEEEQS